MEHQDLDSDKIDILKFVLQHQQGEKDHRREREYRIFTWSSSLLFALIGALLITKQREMIVWEPYGSPGNYIASIAVILLVIYSIAWQIKHNKSRSQNSEVISRNEEFLHCFDEGYFKPDGPALFPAKWKRSETKEFSILRRIWGVNYISATLLLGLLALLMIWTR